ncbi:uncharacterized protein [Spinacia oleracea]|uniref:DUF3741 domain-containing protein n=1 Tax=Spinacia oleracea TaxID=3562 RepID=A0A9R0K9I5_SPIOL|nr:uncharacterized protein LOC110801352 [Spinacia oleracea]
MATKPDFAQKLLHDLRLRKQRMATAQNSDMHGNSRQNIKGSRGTKTLEPVGPKIGSRYRNSSNNQKPPATVQTANQLVPYGGGHHSGQVAGVSMALSYAFDNRGKLKKLDIAGNNSAMTNMLQQVARRSMQQSLDIQWQSTTNEFTHLHIDEIAKGAQKLNQILRACSNGGINIDEGSIEIGKDLWKGAMELEQSLRMLVSLQEASEKGQSRLKLLDENGDSEDDSTVSSEKQRKQQVERPVFSFDKRSKNTKPALQQRVTAIPYLEEDPHSNPERNKPLRPEGSHRRSASCGSEIQTSQLTSSLKVKQNAARLPNVIAKLMGLEELPQNINQKVATESSISQHRNRALVSVHTAQRSSESAEVKTEYSKNAKIQVNQNKVHSSKITILATHTELQEETYRYTNNHKTKDYVKESKEAIFKINELQSKTLYLNKDGRSQNDSRKVRSMKQRQQEGVADDATETLQRMATPENRTIVMAETMQSYIPDNYNARETPKIAARKALIPQLEKNQDIQLHQINTFNEPQEKKLKAENRSQKMETKKSKLRKKEGNAENLQNSRIIARDLKIVQKQLPIKQPNAVKKTEDVGLADSKAILSNRQKEDPVIDGNFTNTDNKTKYSVSLRSNQSGPPTDALSDSNMDAKYMHDSARKVVSDIKQPKIRPVIMKKDEEMTKKVTTPRITERAVRPQRPTSYRLKQNKPGNHDTSQPSIYEESQQNIVVEQTDNKKHTVRVKPSHRLKGATKLTAGDGGENTISIVTDDDQQELVPDEDKTTLQIIATDGQENCKNSSCSQQQKQLNPMKMEKAEPLTEDELFLKQKLIKSHLFLSTAEALFKLNIPMSILNYASDQICEEKDSKIILDCSYEFLKRKGRQEIFFYPSINVFITCTKFRSLDDLVRQLHKDFAALRSYGRNRRGEYDDYANCILKILENDIFNKHPDLNCMWDLGWNELMFPCTKMDEVISTIEQLMLEELVNELINDCL